MTVSMFDFRASLFGMSPLAVECSVSPFQKRFIYKPAIRLYFPIAKCLSFSPYAGVLVDASYLGKYVFESYDYVYERDFFVNFYAGISLYLTALKNVPLEIKSEYRHPIKSLSCGEFYTQGLYVSAQIYIGTIFTK